MVDLLLKAKHWQVFLILVGLPLLMLFIMMGTMFSSMATEPSAQGVMSPFFLPLFGIGTSVSSLGLYAWYWSVGVGLQRFVPDGVNLKVNRFKFFLLFTPIYILLVMTLLPVMGSVEQIISPWIFLIILPLHLLAMFSGIYMLYFSAKTIRSAELKRRASISDYIGEFFLIWFYPIGIWFIQPRINRIAEHRLSSDIDSLDANQF